ncbi:MAG: GxxExxY protein [Chitinophagaceae bacterium]|nr:GxxExxY protein [Chitinophagaceae bacterium]
MKKLAIESIAKELIDAAFEVHMQLGPGLLESVYEYCLSQELRNRSINHSVQCRLPLIYKGVELQKEFYIDMLISGCIIVEIKAVEVVAPVHYAQLLSYMRLANKKLGFLINFNVPLLKDGIKRIVNNY